MKGPIEWSRAVTHLEFSYLAFGYDSGGKLHNNTVELNGLGEGVSRAMQKVHGQEYKIGPVGTTRKSLPDDGVSTKLALSPAEYCADNQNASLNTQVYEVSGCSVDYVDAVIGADYSVTIELRDRGEHGFVLPKKEILPTAEETWAGIKYLLANIKHRS